MIEEKYRQRAQEITKELSLDEKVRLCTGNTYWSTYPLERVGLKECVMSDGPHGVRKVKEKDHLGQSVNEKATGFPVSAAMGATWNKELLYQAGKVLGEECQRIGVDLLLGPAVNMKRSVLGGRNFEYISEDPVLAGKLAAEMVRGLQSTGTGACMKHFACNNSESQRMTLNVEVDERTLHEIYLKVFEIIVKEAQPLAVMGAYNKVNGAYACENEELLTQILRKNWGFDGIVISDWLAVEDCVKAVKAGLNVEMPSNPLVYEKLKNAVADGKLPEEILNQRVTETLGVWLKLQAQRNPVSFSWEDHEETARQMAVQSMVLLKNENQLLPFNTEKISSIAVIGDFAVHPRTQGGGSSKVEAEKRENILEALKKKAPATIRFTYAQGYDEAGETNEAWIREAVEAAGTCDKVVVFAGLPDSYESEGYDRQSMKMPQGHLRLIEAVAKVRKDTLVVLSNGSPIEMPFADQVDGILETWLLGQMTPDAIADVILDLEQPSGRLPETFPRSLADDPAAFNFKPDEGRLIYGERMMIGYRYFEKRGIEPAYPFGYGLTYTEFEYSDLETEQCEKEWKVSFRIKNIGEHSGYEVPQLYLANLQKTRLHPEKELKCFEKIYLEPGEEKAVIFTLKQEDFQCYSSKMKQWITEEGKYEILIGSSSREIRLKKQISVIAEQKIIPELKWCSTLEEWMEHPDGKILAREMLSRYQGFGMGIKTFGELSHFVQRIMLEMPMPRLIIASNGSFTENDLQTMFERLEN